MRMSLAWGQSANFHCQIQSDTSLSFSYFPCCAFATTSVSTTRFLISTPDIHGLPARLGVPIYETSAKKNWHVSDAFEDLLRQMRVRYPAVPRAHRRRGQQSGRHGQPNGSGTTSGHTSSERPTSGDGRSTSPRPDKCIAM